MFSNTGNISGMQQIQDLTVKQNCILLYNHI